MKLKQLIFEDRLERKVQERRYRFHALELDNPGSASPKQKRLDSSACPCVQVDFDVAYNQISCDKRHVALTVYIRWVSEASPQGLSST